MEWKRRRRGRPWASVLIDKLALQLAIPAAKLIHAPKDDLEDLHRNCDRNEENYPTENDTENAVAEEYLVQKWLCLFLRFQPSLAPSLAKFSLVLAVGAVLPRLSNCEATLLLGAFNFG
jgi:hypothetical protein